MSGDSPVSDESPVSGTLPVDGGDEASKCTSVVSSVEPQVGDVSAVDIAALFANSDDCFPHVADAQVAVSPSGPLLGECSGEEYPSEVPAQVVEDSSFSAEVCAMQPRSNIKPDLPSDEMSADDHRGSVSFPHVPPEPFDTDGYRSFRSFIRCYERYFTGTFATSYIGMATQLGDYLVGRMRNAYDTLMRYAPSYDDLKAKLMCFYKLINVSNQEKAAEEFRNLRMRAGHSVLLHCLQLEELAKKAFHRGSERWLRLLQQVFNTVPEDFHLQFKGLYVSAPEDDGPCFEWEDLISLAGSYDKQHWKPAPVRHLRRGRNRRTTKDSLTSSDGVLSPTSGGDLGSTRHCFRQRTKIFWNTKYHRP